MYMRKHGYVAKNSVSIIKDSEVEEKPLVNKENSREE